MKKLSGRVAVVTGAASGLGRALALGLGQAGCSLALVDIDADGLEQLAATLRTAGTTVSTHPIDVASAEQMAALPQEVIARHGAVHIVINNAGVNMTAGFHDTTLADWNWMLGINLWGVIHGCHFFLPHLRLAEEASLVNISSVFGVVGLATQSAYCTSKFAVRGLSESLWEETRGTQLQVLAVHPGGINTGIIERSRCVDDALKDHLVSRFRIATAPPEKVAARIIRAIRRGQRRLMVTPEARLLDWLKRLMPEWGNGLSNWLVARMMGINQFRDRLMPPPVDPSSGVGS